MNQLAMVTGAAGFIGSHLSDALLRNGYDVCGVDNLVTGSRDNLIDARKSTRFHFIEADITNDPIALFLKIESDVGSPSRVFHFASPASPIDYANLPIETMLANSRGTQFCLDASRRWGARLLFASTSETYGDPLEHPQRETYWGNVNSVGPRSCYDESKRFGEALVMAYVRVFDIDARIIRIFNTYGPRMRKNDGRVIPNFLAQITKGEPLTLYGDGSQTRSFCYVDDLVYGVILCMASEKTRARVLNLGNPEEYTIKEMASVLSDIAGVDLTTEMRDLPVDDPTRRCPDITRARDLLGWTPHVSLREGLKRVVESNHVSAKLS